MTRRIHSTLIMLAIALTLSSTAVMALAGQRVLQGLKDPHPMAKASVTTSAVTIPGAVLVGSCKIKDGTEVNVYLEPK
jgi:Mn2+/Fe2+ NRAMP family transporter